MSGGHREPWRIPGLPAVTVIVPVCNGERTIEACVAPVLRCDYPESLREVVVVDNASTDRTADIVRTFPVGYVHEPKRGRSYARNRGIHVSEGPILAFTDADCVVAESWLRELVGAFDDDAVSAVAGEILPDQPRTPGQRYMAMRKCAAVGGPHVALALRGHSQRRLSSERIRSHRHVRSAIHHRGGSGHQLAVLAGRPDLALRARRHRLPPPPPRALGFLQATAGLGLRILASPLSLRAAGRLARSRWTTRPDAQAKVDRI